MGNAKFLGLPAPKPLSRFSKKNLQGWLRGGLHPTGKYWGQSVQGGVSAHAWNCHPQASIFFLFLGFMRLATGRPVGPIVVVDSSNDASSWRSRPFYDFVNKKIFFSIFNPKMWKTALCPMETLKSYHFGTVEDMYKMFAPNRGFSGSAI